MLSCSDVEGLIQQMQTLRSELPGAEAKDARRGLPQRIYEGLSAFGNRRGGGVIVFGLEDGAGYRLGPESDRSLEPLFLVLELARSGRNTDHLLLCARLETGERFELGGGPSLIGVAEAAARVPRRPQTPREA